MKIRHKQIKILAILFSALLASGAETVTVSGPVSAVIFDARSQSIRVITGVPGAAMLGAKLADQIRQAEIAPDGNTALAVGSPATPDQRSLRRANEGASLYAILGLMGANPAWVPLPFASRTVDRMAWNSTSSAAAAYSAASRTVLLITNISPAGATETAISVASLQGELTALAVDGAGDAAIAALSGNAGGVYLLMPNHPPALLAPVAQPSSIYLHQDQDLFITDAASLQIFEVLNYRGVARLAPFAPLPQGASLPVGLAMSPDNQFVFAADQACRCLATYQFSTGTLLSQTPLQDRPAFLKPASSGRQFVLNSPIPNDTPFWILSAGATPLVYFVSNSGQ